MKLYPTCQQTYTDETLKFCRDDGASLVSNGLRIIRSYVDRGNK